MDKSHIHDKQEESQPAMYPQQFYPVQHPGNLASYSSFIYMANGPSFGDFAANHSVVVHNEGMAPSPDLSPSHLQDRAPTNRQWFDYLLQMAHSKYNAQDLLGAMAILQDLANLDNAHLQTLLLLGCVCYSLKLYSHSILYNRRILELDPKFAEAYSNLGTTMRALAMDSGALVEINAGFRIAPADALVLPTTPAESLKLAETYYRNAAALRPKYWDATINLAGLLSSQSRWLEALEVYQSIEAHMEAEFPADERFDTIKRFAETPPLLMCELDRLMLTQLMAIEQKKLRRIQIHTAYGRPAPGESSGFTIDRRRDLYFGKGNLLYTMNDPHSARIEYFKGLVAVGLDITALIDPAIVNLVPAASVTPQQSMLALKQRYLATDHVHHSTTSSILQTVAKIYQDLGLSGIAIRLYYISLEIFPTANSCNNLGILISSQRITEAIQWYEFGLSLEPNHVHLYTNLGSALKDRGHLQAGVQCYEQAIAIQPTFFIALANLANLYKDMNRIDEAIALYRRALAVQPDFVEAFCNCINCLLYVCDWTDRDKHLDAIRDIVLKQLQDGGKCIPRTVPTVLPFHTFTYSSLPAWMVREISRCNADRILWHVTSSDWFPGFPRRPKHLGMSILKRGSPANNALNKNLVNSSLQYPYPYPVPEHSNIINIGYISSDFTNHPLAHLMQSVFRLHSRSSFRVFCYALTPSDQSPYRHTIETGTDVFLDVSQWTNQQIIERIALVDKIHVLCNLNGYTKGGRNEIFAARPAPLQIALMGFAGTMGAGQVNDPEHPELNNAGEASSDLALLEAKMKETDVDPFFDDLKYRWIDYLVSDEIASPAKFVCGQALDGDEVVPAGTELVARGPVAAGDDRNRVYTEGMIYMPFTYFVNDHRQGFREKSDALINHLINDIINGLDTNGSVASASQKIPLVPFDEDADLSPEECKEWRKEQITRLKMRQTIFPWLEEDTVIFANFNQLYKLDPNIFATWMNVLKRLPNSILWLLRFPPSGEAHIRQRAIELVGLEVCKRLVFTDVAPKDQHIHRGRVADVFLDTPECNAHTTAADILWSGTPILTYPKYDFKMCSRVAASIAYSTGSWVPNDRHYVADGGKTGDRKIGIRMDIRKVSDVNLLGHYMVVNSYQEYEEKALELGSSLRWGWTPVATWKQVDRSWMPPVARSGPSTSCFFGTSLRPISNALRSIPVISPDERCTTFYPSPECPTHIYVPFGLAADLRRRLFLSRDTMPLFDTPRWVRDFEKGVQAAYSKWRQDYSRLNERNQREYMELTSRSVASFDDHAAGQRRFGSQRCIFVNDEFD